MYITMCHPAGVLFPLKAHTGRLGVEGSSRAMPCAAWCQERKWFCFLLTQREVTGPKLGAYPGLLSDSASDSEHHRIAIER